VLISLTFIAQVDERVKFVPNYNVAEARFTIHNTIAPLLQNDCEQVIIKTK